MNSALRRRAAPRPHLIAGLAFLSGVGGLVYEVLYLRQLTPVLGDMYYVHAALLCVFLAGAGIGAKLAQHLAPRLFLVELLIGAYALLFPDLVAAYTASPLYLVIAQPAAGSVLAAALLLTIPALAIGVSVPAFSAYLEAHGRHATPFQSTYFLYHLATAASVLLVELFLVRTLGLRLSLALVAGGNLLCGVALWLLPRLAAPTAAAGRAIAPRGDIHALILASLASALFQGFYLKLCYHLFGPHRENFAICTAVVLLGLALGGMLVARRQLRFSTCVTAAALAVATVGAVFGPLAWSYALLRDHALPGLTELGALPGSAGLISLKLVYAALIGGAPALFLGATIPALVGRGRDGARRGGHLLLVSGLANAAGLLLYTFVVHPALPVFAVVPLASGVLIAALLVHRGREGLGGMASRRALLVGGGITLLLLIATTRPARQVYLVNLALPANSQVEHLKSAADSVSYVREPGRSWISFNGHPSITIERAGRPNLSEVFGAVLPALAAPRSDRAMVVGLGAGITAGALAQIFERVEVAEINGAFIELAPRLARTNFALHQNPRAHIYHQDARRLLAERDGDLDLVVNEAPTPTFFAASKLYTVEFFRLVEHALTSDGVFATGYAPGGLDRASLDTLLATLGEVFAHCHLATLRDLDYNYYSVMCSARELRVRSAAEAGLSAPLRATLASATDGDVEHLLRCSFISGDLLAAPSQDRASINTDDLPVMEDQLSRLALPGRARPPDFVVASPAAFSVRLPALGEPTSEDLAVYWRLHRPLFEALLRPRLEQQPRLRARFCEQVRRAGDQDDIGGLCPPGHGLGSGSPPEDEGAQGDGAPSSAD